MELIEKTIDLIRQYGSSSALVILRLLEICVLVIPHLTDHEALTALEHQVMAIDEGVCSGLPQQIDRERVRHKLTAVHTAFGLQRDRCYNSRVLN
jgi:uncharacterized membrane protein